MKKHRPRTAVRSARSHIRRAPRAVHRLPAKDRIKEWLRARVLDCRYSLTRLWRSPLSFLFTVVVIAMALSLPTALYVAARNFETFGASLRAASRIDVFLKLEVSEASALKLTNQLRADDRFRDVVLIGKDAAVQEFRKSSGFGDSIDTLGFNPLPAVVELELTQEETDLADVTLKALRQLPEVDLVQADLQWMKRLKALVKAARTVGTALSVGLGLAVVLIVSNTIRLELQQCVAEIEVKRMVGATRGFILRPFVASGFLYGFLGSVGTVFVVDGWFWALNRTFVELSEFYTSRIHMSYLGIGESVVVVVTASLLGMAGSALVTIAFLRRVEMP